MSHHFSPLRLPMIVNDSSLTSMKYAYDLIFRPVYLSKQDCSSVFDREIMIHKIDHSFTKNKKLYKPPGGKKMK